MAWFKRISLFLLTNILVVVTISIVLNVLGIRPYLSAQGIDYGSLLAFCLVWGFGGALISLAMSRLMAKWMMGVQLIDPQTSDPQLRWLVSTVDRMAKASGITTTPEVGVYDSPELNAFATGPTKNRSLVAVSSGLLTRMSPSEVEGVLSHEIAHVANGDMVTMTLIQGVVNAFVMFFARIIGWAISQNVREENQAVVNGLVVFVLEILFSFLGFMVVASFSRWREFRADAGGARLGGREKMISALRALQRNYEPSEQPVQQEAVAALKISGKSSGFMALLSTHPPLEVRIERLQSAGR